VRQGHVTKAEATRGAQVGAESLARRPADHGPSLRSRLPRPPLRFPRSRVQHPPREAPAVSSTSCSKEPQPTVLSPRLSALSTIRLELLKLDAPHHPVLRFAKRRPGATPRGTPQPGRCPRGEIGRATEGALGTPFITRGLCLDHQPGKRNRCNRAQNRESKPDGHVRAPFRITEAEVLWAAPLNHSGRKPEVRRRRPRRRGPTFRFPSLRRIPGRAPRPGQESPAAFSSGVFPSPTGRNKPRSSCRPS